MGRTKIRGPARDGAEVFDEGRLTHRVLDAYGDAVDRATAQREGQGAGAAVLAARRRLWALAERLVPRRLAAALRARAAPGDTTGREGVRELRLAIADWLDPPPCCRWCSLPIRPGDEARICAAARGQRRRALERVASGTLAPVLADAEAVVPRTPPRRAWTAHARACRPSKTRRTPGAPAACGTLALYPAGYVSLETMAAALACPCGAAGDYDVAADRDSRALLAATCPAPPPRRDAASPSGDAPSWSSEYLQAIADAVADHGEPGPLPSPLLAARLAFERARNNNIRTNGRIVTGVQTRYYAPQHGATRADILQGGAIGLDRAALDYDASKASFVTHAAEWTRQGCGDAWSARDLVDTPPWVHDLRRKIVAALESIDAGPDAPAELLRAIEALAEVGSRRSAADSLRAALISSIADLADLLGGGIVPADVDALAEAATAPRPPAAKWHKRLRAGARGSRPRAPWQAKRKANALDLSAAQILADLAEDPERARERVAVVVARLLEIDRGKAKITGSGILTALRHGAPVFVRVGAGGDDEESTQGTDGAGGTERAAAVLAASDDFAARDDEADSAATWSQVLSYLERLQALPGEGPVLAEVVRRYHGLDSAAEDSAGVGESFAAIGERGIGPGGERRVVGKETVRQAYTRALTALRAMAAGDPVSVAGDLAWLEWADEPAPTPLRWRPARVVTTTAAAPTQTSATAPSRAAIDASDFDAFRESAASVSW